MMMAHGGANGGRSHGGEMAADSRGLTNGGGAGGGGARGGDGEPTSQGDAGDPGGHGGADGSGDRGEGGSPEIRGGAERLRTQVELTGGRSPTEPVGRSNEAQSRGYGGSTPTKAEPKVRGSPVELIDRRVTVEARELGAEVEPLGLRAETESGPRRLEAEVRDNPAPATLEDCSFAGLAPYRWGAEGERRGCQTTAAEEAGAGGRAGIFEERALEDLKPPQGWTREPRMALRHRWARAGAPHHGEMVGWALGLESRSSSWETVRGDPFLARVHSTKAVNSARGPSSDDSALHTVLRLAS